MSGFVARFLALACALALDRLLGEPDWLWRRIPHPAVLMGNAVGWFDHKLNDEGHSFEERRWMGILAIALLCGLAALAGLAAHVALAALPFGWLIEAVIVAIFLAQRSLIDHVADVARALPASVELAREAVARIVGRDVAGLDEPGVARAAIESLAENFSDGVVAPALWYLLLGLPGLFAYKLANTADSMIGNRSARHEAFGWASARLDDFLNFVPARLSALAIIAAARPMGFDAVAARRAVVRDARRHRSPNAGWPEAATAGALGLALGGPRRYGELEVDGAWLNSEGSHGPAAEAIDAATRLIDAAWACLVMFAALGAVTLLAIGR